jgi:chemosensory pili system protein ChpA (sensor histidine kinase/response regulator)
VSTPNQDMLEVFLQEASEHLQFLREYSSVLQDPYPAAQDLDRLYVAAHTLVGSSGLYQFKFFAEVASKLAHIFQYAINAGISQEASGPLVEFIYEGIAVLESDLLMVSTNGVESEDEFQGFKEKYPYAFQSTETAKEPEPVAAPEPERHPMPPASWEPEPLVHEAQPPAQVALPTFDEPALVLEEASPVVSAPLIAEPAAVPAPSPTVLPARVAAPVRAAVPVRKPEPPKIQIPDLAPDDEVPAEVLEFFVPEVEEHIQAVTDCLLSLEANPNPEDIHRLFRAIHTIKGSAAQVGLHRISRVAHRAEDLIGRLRDGELRPSASIVDICLESVDALKKFLYNQWPDEVTLQTSVKSLLTRIANLAPEEQEEGTAPAAVEEAPPPSMEDFLGIAEQPKTVVPDAPAPQPAPVAPSHAAAIPAGPAFVPPSTIEPPRAPEHKEAAAIVPDHSPEAEEIIVGSRKASGGTPPSKSVRIGLERLDRMMNAVGELVINRTRMLGRVAELERLADVLNFSKARLIDKVTEFQEKHEFNNILGDSSQPQSRPQNYPPLASMSGFAPPDSGWPVSESYPFRGGYSSYSHSFDSSLAEFSELEMDRYDEFNILSRSLTEISADITEVLSQLDGFVRRVDGDIDEFTKLAHRLQDEITQARMVPIGNLYTRIARTARDAAKASNKLIDLKLEGDETELDNNIIQQIADPLLHLVRNSVAHGIERAEERYESGKSDHGNVAVRAYHRGNHIYIEVEDDGRGIDYEKVRHTATDLGLLSAEQAAQTPDHDLLELLFHPGFSTAPRKTELAGRGVGLDVVRANLTALNGEIEIDTQKGVGTRFTLKVPLTLIISQALFVRCGAAQFAFPLSFVEEIRRLRESDIEEVGEKLLTKVRDEVTEIVRLDRELGLPPIEPVNGFYRLVIVNISGRQVGIVVEEVLRKDEIVIKNMGEYLRNVKLFPGATIAPDGSLILLVDLNRLVVGESIEHKPLMLSAAAARVFAPGSMAVAHNSIPRGAIAPMPDEKVIVLADDSISVRKFVGRMLEKAGYRVKLAADGLEALEIVLQGGCDLVITDLEMPRTNGYELMMHLRQNPDTKRIPVMVVTSRAGAKHRERAMSEGATAFMVKPVQEDQLIASVAQMIGHALPHLAANAAAAGAEVQV